WAFKKSRAMLSITSRVLRTAGVTLLSVLVLGLPALASADTQLFTNNPGFESGSTGWTQDSFGTIGASYSVVAGGHTGSAGSIVVNSVTGDAEAKWLSPAIPVTAGQIINLSDWYKSTALTSVFVYDNLGGIQWVR